MSMIYSLPIPVYRCNTLRPQWPSFIPVNVSHRRSKGTLPQASSRRASLAMLIGSVSFLGTQNELSWAASDADALTIMEVGGAITWIPRPPRDYRPCFKNKTSRMYHCYNPNLLNRVHVLHSVSTAKCRRQLSKLTLTVILTKLSDYLQRSLN